MMQFDVFILFIGVLFVLHHHPLCITQPPPPSHRALNHYTCTTTLSVRMCSEIVFNGPVRKTHFN